eukprot:3290496-Prorocentrum_lima.AAC.1
MSGSSSSSHGAGEANEQRDAQAFFPYRNQANAPTFVQAAYVARHLAEEGWVAVSGGGSRPAAADPIIQRARVVISPGETGRVAVEELVRIRDALAETANRVE